MRFLFLEEDIEDEEGAWQAVGVLFEDDDGTVVLQEGDHLIYTLPQKPLEAYEISDFPGWWGEIRLGDIRETARPAEDDLILSLIHLMGERSRDLEAAR